MSDTKLKQSSEALDLGGVLLSVAHFEETDTGMSAPPI